MEGRGGCLNGSSAGKRRIADNIGTRMTASFFVDNATDPTNIWDRDLLIVISAGATVLIISVAMITLMTLFVIRHIEHCDIIIRTRDLVPSRSSMRAAR
ncbi:jg6733 [Pararge aegeria aegeria]|uniref:Jg6733 protein n=1 Tax=Pararge aegeria aegeria TaxID=348720 RepID=A0A8S4R583_9NEOP|nr:jg6733 [Pararge aegeria aegeria]